MSTGQFGAVDVEPRSASQAVVERVARCEGVDQTELDLLYDVVDPDALDRLVGPGGRDDQTLRVEFTYHGYVVTVRGDGVVHLAEEGNSE